jgi:HK97 family phage prohead protease
MSRAYTPRDEFVKAAAAGTAPADSVLRKQFVSSIEKASDSSRTFVVSTAAADRDNDCVAVDGWQLENYKKNPVILFAHDYSSLPIGKCTNIRTLKGKLVADCEFADHDMAKTVLKLVDGGFLNATSVGFRPIKYAMNEARKGMDFSEQELLEFSIVPVPANPEALIVARELMGDVALMKQWATQVLDVLKEAPLSPKSDMGEVDDEEKGKKPKPATGNEDPQPGQDHKPEDPNDKKGKQKPPADEEDEPGQDQTENDPNDDDGKKPFQFAPKKFAEMVAAAVVEALKTSSEGAYACACMKDAGHEPSACTCCMKGACSGACCAGKAVGDVVEKRGRVLSAKNESKVRAAHSHLDEVLKSVGIDTDTEEDALDIDETVTKAEDVIVIDLVEVEKKAAVVPDFSDMRDVMRDALKDIVRSTVNDIIKHETTATLNRLRGRLD